MDHRIGLTRRAFMKAVGVGAAGFALNGCAAAATAPTEGRGRRQPNIIYILADDLGYGDLSCYGQKKFTTPSIDQIGRASCRVRV